ncbi:MULTISPECIES: tRNA (adenosine(37)-N6)-dimethylallyltransferase MiaA [unclassified Agarivorans]|uniref:tRNA (adenosine(37)-N6)-dimethylallyltransferase MiaA n=1 Tax=unclassified Agarivorans TaxID=2636026 RepID=UPI0026E1374F|nr:MULTISPECIES: tRNA (adenosine(37)-N6)-dimethylallyltransferase MiaA [unclassified Agarivorans]MDO6686822.1 tRNA (adenosine(37)-N6)-dimethylallyltransferase MiaA [Agarivorans sp. 3_MG-2023]MDO6716447.1 tRNA (adenosine(37)-N6)-dimethylallyltransferase MiaA [Agarivorans sp. 2_MG-2023]
MQTHSANLIVVLGPTASGKTHLGVELARHYNGEVLSADSRQVYRGLDIGSGKDLAEYQEIPYHLIDIVEPDTEYSVFHFQRDFFAAYAQIKQAKKLPIMVGGTGLYIDAVTQNYQLNEAPVNKALRDELATLSLETLQQRLLALKPEQHNSTDLTVRPRLVRAIEIAEADVQVSGQDVAVHPTITPLYIGIRWDRSVLRERITLRLKQRLEEGLIEEVQRLHSEGVSYQKLEFYGLEYRLVAQHLQEQLTYNDMFQKLNSQIHQFAKRQDTWFRKMERRGDVIHWLDPQYDLVEQAKQVVEPQLHSLTS